MAARIEQTIDLLPFKTYSATGYDPDHNAVNAGLSAAYVTVDSIDEDGNLTPDALADTVLGDGYKKTAQAYADTSNCVTTVARASSAKLVLNLSISAKDPLLADIPGITPSVDANVQISVDYSDPFHPKYIISGSHDAWPCFQIFINSHGADMYDSAGHTPWALFGGNPVQVMRSGEIDPKW